MIRTASLIVLALYTSEMHPSICVEAVEKLGKYFYIYFQI